MKNSEGVRNTKKISIWQLVENIPVKKPLSGEYCRKIRKRRGGPARGKKNNADQKPERKSDSHKLEGKERKSGGAGPSGHEAQGKKMSAMREGR